MPTLSKTAQKSLKNNGGYSCKAPKVPFRYINCDREAFLSYNYDYLKAFVDGINAGTKVWRTDEGVVTTARCTWVHAEHHVSTDNDSDFDNVADVYMHFPAGTRWVGYLVKRDSLTAARANITEIL